MRTKTLFLATLLMVTTIGLTLPTDAESGRRHRSHRGQRVGHHGVVCGQRVGHRGVRHVRRVGHRGHGRGYRSYRTHSRGHGYRQYARHYGRYGYSPYGRHFGSYGYSPYGSFYRGGYPGYYQSGPTSHYGSLRIEGDPKPFRNETVILVNGAAVGVVDEFDGYSQRLYLPPGEYELEFRLDGYESVKQVIYVAPGRSYNIRYAMFPTHDDDEGGP